MTDTRMPQPDPEPRLQSKDVWLRGLFMLLFAFIWTVAEVVMFAVAVVQFGFALFTGNANAALRRFGIGLSVFIGDVVRFLTFASDAKPFPFEDWPEAPSRAYDESL